MSDNEKPAPAKKTDQLLIRTTTELAEQVRATAFLKGETLHEWLARVAAPELTDTSVGVFNLAGMETE
jgi:hypothetical protein